MPQDVVVGVSAAVISAVAYGSTYVPVRWFEIGDGLFFQWIMCIGQILFGIVVLATVGWPPVFPLAMLSGVFFASGNALTVYIMDGIGMAVGSLLWNTITCIIGWAVTRFGILGNPQQLPHHNVMNIIGVITVCIGAILLTLFVGSLYGNMMTPINYLMIKSAQTDTSFTNSSYFFSYCIGALLTSTVIFMIYSLIRFNRPFINPDLILPSIFSGIIYATATYCFFLANENLDQTIAYPILAKAPGIIVSLWAVFLFKEIKGCYDLTKLSVGISITITGISLIAISKIQF
ncbi:hypothetical protein DICVIV_10208 [Dictyocaulus viviparus]|uniref:Sugar transport protein n=1 Tax=Dictyocaulus viviparus TaxID=29172 RepID=A0A0D8XJ17_DICVI|nr:hypothetical protein DICVIV_10208 [Dictyocaulus viviparus]